MILALQYLSEKRENKKVPSEMLRRGHFYWNAAHWQDSRMLELLWEYEIY